MAPSVAEIYDLAAAAGACPDPLLLVSEWADQYRTLSPLASAEPGPWRTERTPYLGEIMDALSAASPIERVVLIKASQLGGTECGNNWIGYVIAHCPGPLMAVQPTVEMARRNSKQRIDPLIEESDVLRKLVSSPRSRDSGNTMLAKEFPGGILVMTGANSAVGLRSMAARYLFLDEIDAYPGDVDGEGDPVNLAIARTRTFARRKIFMVSTPKITGRSRIESAFEESDQRWYWVPCPTCYEYQILRFPQLRWPKGKPEEAVYICEHCSAEIQNHQKHGMLGGGEWRSASTGDGKTAGFHLSSLYSPVGWFSWAEAAAMFEKAHKDPALLQVFVNTVLGESWALQGEAPEWQRLYDRRGDYPIGRVPAGGLFLTCGVDVQRDRIEVEIVAWGRGKQSWSVDYRVMDGDTSGAEVWTKLTALLGERFQSEGGVDMNITRMAVDSGYATQEVYAWSRMQASGRVMVVKGVDRAAVPVGQPTALDVTHAGKRITRGIKVWPVSVGILKSELYGWLRLERPSTETGAEFPPGYCHFPKYQEEYFKQLTAEQLVTRVVKGYRRTEWQKTRDRNEGLDCRIYARAAAAIYGMDRFTDQVWDGLEQKMSELTKQVGEPPRLAPPPARRVIRGRWIDPEVTRDWFS